MSLSIKCAAALLSFRYPQADPSIIYGMIKILVQNGDSLHSTQIGARKFSYERGDV